MLSDSSRIWAVWEHGSKKLRTERNDGFGVYFDVESISETEAEAKLQNGEFPDVISFPAGFLNGRELRIMNGTEIFGIDGTAVDFGDGYGAGELPAGFDWRHGTGGRCAHFRLRPGASLRCFIRKGLLRRK